MKWVSRFHFVTHDTKDRKSKLSERWGLRNNRAYLIIFDPDGEMLIQLGANSSLNFTEEIQRKLEKVELDYYSQLDGLMEFIVTQKDRRSDTELHTLVAQLDSDRYVIRAVATKQLLAAGVPALQYLRALDRESTDLSLETERRLSSIEKQLENRMRMVTDRNLSHNVPFLLRRSSQVAGMPNYVREILNEFPETKTMNAEELLNWWAENSGDLNWHEDQQIWIRN